MKITTLKIFFPLLLLAICGALGASQTAPPLNEGVKAETRMGKAKKVIAKIGSSSKKAVKCVLGYRKTCIFVSILSIIFLPVLVCKIFNNELK